MQVQHASCPYKTTVSVIKTVGTLKDILTRTHALMHTRAYVQQARACWKWEILMRFITYKPITIKKKHAKGSMRHTEKWQQLPACLCISSHKQPRNLNYYLPIIPFFKEKCSEQVEPSALNQGHRREDKKSKILIRYRGVFIP